MKPFGILHEEQATSVATARFDLSAFIEKDIPVPLMHRSLGSLEEINNLLGFRIDSIPNVKRQDAVRVWGAYCGNQELQVDAVWVKASSNRYRKALEQRNLTANLISSRLPSGLHADHIVNRASLTKMISAGHEPWVMLFEVPASSNVNFGSKYEKYLPKFLGTEAMVHLAAPHIFKLYCTDWPKGGQEFEESLAQISAQINNVKIIDTIRAEFTGIFDSR